MERVDQKGRGSLGLLRLSEMVDRIERHDWSSTPLGPIEAWPSNLKTAVGIMLGAGERIAVYWGPDLILLYNNAWKELIGRKHPLALGRPAREVFPEIWNKVGPMLESVMSGRGAADACEDHLPLDRNGGVEDAWFDYSFDPIPNEDGSVGGVFNIAVESTGRVSAERSLRELNSHLEQRVRERIGTLEASEDEARTLSRQRGLLTKHLVNLLEEDRWYICGVLHDDVAQTLTGTKMAIENIRSDLAEKAPGPAERLDDVVNSLQGAIAFLRDTSCHLCPSSLEILGLVGALRSLGDGVQTDKCPIHFLFREVPDSLDRELEIAVFRIAQEAVNNAIHHGKCNEIHLSLVGRNNTLYLTVEDDGCGFDRDRAVSESSSGTTMGLLLMQGRAASAGGELHVEASPGRGTVVIAEIPLKGPSAA